MPGLDLPAVIQALAQAGATRALTRLRSVDQRLLAAALAALPMAPVLPADLLAGPGMALPTGGQLAGMPAFSDPAFDRWFAAQPAGYGIGLYGEDRQVYRTARFADAASAERRTVRLGLDLFAPAGTPVFAPMAGRVWSVSYNADPLDYGHTLILSHEVGAARIFNLYGHLGGSLPGLVRAGQEVAVGQLVAHPGDWPENGGWAPHLHLQIVTDLLDQRSGNFFGVGHASLWDIWQQISPDPNLILRLAPSRFGP